MFALFLGTYEEKTSVCLREESQGSRKHHFKVIDVSTFSVTKDLGLKLNKGEKIWNLTFML